MMVKSVPDISVFDVANWFLAKARQEGQPLKHMKLQKLVYFAYGWYFAYFDKPLFPQGICAWDHGPVVSDLYSRFKRFGGSPIDDTEYPPLMDNDILSILDDVWESYSPYNDIQLRNITHRSDSPWTQVYSVYRKGAEIRPSEIREYFCTLKNK